jgi:integrase
MTAKRRRSFGKKRYLTTRSKHPTRYIEASYPTPVEAFGQYPGLKERQYRNFPIAWESQADRWLADAETAIRTQTWKPEATVKAKGKAIATLFGDYADDWIATHRQPNGKALAVTTKQKYGEYLDNHLRAVFGDTPVASITPKMVQDFWDGYPVGANGVGETGRLRCYRFLAAVLNTAASKPIDDTGEPLIPSNPCHISASNPRAQHEVIIAMDSEIPALYEAMPPRYALAVYLGGVMALRRGEVLGLQRRDVDIANGLLHIRHSAKPVKDAQGHIHMLIGDTKTPKSVRDRTIPVELLPLVRQHLALYVGRKATAYLFSQGSGEPLYYSTLGSNWAKARKTVPRLASMRFHDLRHTALTRYAVHGATLRELMDIAGHTNITMAMHYQQVAQDHAETVNESVGRSIVLPNGFTVEEPEPSGDDEVTRLARQLAGLDAEQRNKLVALLQGGNNE